MSRFILWLASRLVPLGSRSRFRREWEAEIAHAGASRPATLVARSLGSVPHALYLLKSDWRTDAMMQDLKYALRSLAERPLFVIAAASTLAIGIGANTALFSVLDAVVLRPLAYRDPGELVAVFETHESLGGSQDGPSPANVIDWNVRSRTLTGIAAWWVESTTLLGGASSDTEEVPSARVTADFFDVFGVEPAHGRTFAPDDVAGEPRRVVLGYDLWMRRFGGRIDVVGSDIPFKNGSWRVVGVMPPSFRTPGTLPGEVQLFKPWDLEHSYGSMPGRARDHRFLRAAARLAPGTTLPVARSELSGIASALAEEYPKTNDGWGVELVPLDEALIGNTRSALFVLLGAVGLVLLLACANVASLLLVRASGRSREMAVRTALGASRLRLSRQLLLESFALAAAGGILGLAVARVAVETIGHIAPAGVPRIDEAALDLRVVVFAILMIVVSAIVAGIGPALHGSTASPVHALKDGAGTVSSERGRRRLRSLIVVAEIAAAVMLLVGSGLFLQSFSRVLNVPLGFDANALLVVRMRLDSAVYGGGGADAYYRELLQSIRTLPGVTAAGGATGLPMDALDIDFERPFWKQGEPRPDGGGAGVQIRMATEGYFETMRIPLLAGREVDPRDDRTKPRIAIVNETMARQTWPGERAVGQRLFIDYQNYEAVYEVVGVVGDTRFYGHRHEPRRAVYIPHAQNPYLPLNLVVRSDGDVASLGQVVRRRALELDPNQPVHSVRTMAELMSGHVGRDRFTAWLMASFAAMALTLAAIGIYGIVAFSVSQRRKELGLRVAVGARRADVTRLVLASGVKLAIAGVAVGLAGALLGSRALASMLFGVSASDPMTFLAAGAVLTVTALAACYFPARRAAQLDPLDALRFE